MLPEILSPGAQVNAGQHNFARAAIQGRLDQLLDVMRPPVREDQVPPES